MSLSSMSTLCFYLSLASSITITITLLPSRLKNIIVIRLNLFIFREVLMCTSGILNTLATTLHLLSLIIVQYTIVILYSLLFVETYHSIIKSNKPLIIALMDLLGACFMSIRFIKDVLKTLFALALYSLNRTTLVKLSVLRTDDEGRVEQG